jgi:hypothetical protein
VILILRAAELGQRTDTRIVQTNTARTSGVSPAAALLPLGARDGQAV